MPPSDNGPILVTGGAGQLARAIAARADVRRVGRPEFDFDAPETIPGLLRNAAPSLIVNAAAYTAVDKAESEPEAADRANRQGPALLARYAAEADIPLIHVSTDYVFDGTKAAPYVETDPTNPTGVYGATKRAGEEEVLALCPKAVILRTSWVYASEGKNFVLTMLGAARRLPKLRVVADQRGCPTNADDLADAVLAVAARLGDGWRDEYRGIFHAAGTGETTWHGFASAIFAAAEPHGLARPEVEAIRTDDWPTPARRPADSRLDTAKLGAVFGVQLPHWEPSLRRTVAQIFARQPA